MVAKLHGSLSLDDLVLASCVGYSASSSWRHSCWIYRTIYHALQPRSKTSVSSLPRKMNNLNMWLPERNTWPTTKCIQYGMIVYTFKGRRGDEQLADCVSKWSFNIYTTNRGIIQTTSQWIEWSGPATRLKVLPVNGQFSSVTIHQGSGTRRMLSSKTPIGSVESGYLHHTGDT
jgi:hypothetical protein